MISKHPLLRYSLRALALASGLAAAGCASTSNQPPATAPISATTFDEQVAAGGKLYEANCASCHGADGKGTAKAPAVVGIKAGALPLDPPPERQLRKTKFETVADVASFVVANMPPKKAGTLTNNEYWAILAFDLHANGVDLPAPLTPEMAPGLVIPR
jgi:cytochrome c